MLFAYCNVISTSFDEAILQKCVHKVNIPPESLSALSVAHGYPLLLVAVRSCRHSSVLYAEFMWRKLMAYILSIYSSAKEVDCTRYDLLLEEGGSWC